MMKARYRLGTRPARINRSGSPAARARPSPRARSRTQPGNWQHTYYSHRDCVGRPEVRAGAVGPTGPDAPGPRADRQGCARGMKEEDIEKLKVNLLLLRCDSLNRVFCYVSQLKHFFV
jgi:hypothetical protein